MNTPRPPTLKAVALGGGHGLHATLSALRLLTDDVTAVVTVADDGGSSRAAAPRAGPAPAGRPAHGDRRAGRRRRAGPPVAHPRAAPLRRRSARWRATRSATSLIAGLIDTLGDPVAALDAVASLLGVRGRVLPMCTEPLDIGADVTGLGADPERAHRIRGQVAVASTPGRVQRVWLVPDQPRACPDAVAAVSAADVVVLGPGSWFTSVLPHLLVPDLRDALIDTAARRIIVLNLAPEPGETAGFSPEQHLAVVCEHAPALRVDAVLADVDAVPVPDRLHSAATAILSPGGRVHLAPVAASPIEPSHDPAALAAAIAAVVADVATSPDVAAEGRT